MIELHGEYNKAKVYTNNVDQHTQAQVIRLLNQEFVKHSNIRIMPDCHAGAGCVIGTTMTITDKVVPNLVGVDVSCGMEVVQVENKHVELSKLDKVVHEKIPAGFNIRDTIHRDVDESMLNDLRCINHVNVGRSLLSIGSLGGGNHFIEMNKDDDGNLYLVVHSGSRNLGKQVAEYYQDAGFKALSKQTLDINKIVSELKAQGREKDISAELKKYTAPKVEKALAYVEGQLFDDYLHDIKILQKYADLNRKIIIQEICKAMKFKITDQFTTIHNYIDTESMMLRKGAISAKLGERVLIPINMRDGSLICVGKGNADWNYSAPHGAGRLMSRSAAKDTITLSAFKKSMEGIYSSTVTKDTIDESPMAYKPMEEIIANTQDTVMVVQQIKPIYNFKAADDEGPSWKERRQTAREGK